MPPKVRRAPKKPLSRATSRSRSGAGSPDASHDEAERDEAAPATTSSFYTHSLRVVPGLIYAPVPPHLRVTMETMRRFPNAEQREALRVLGSMRFGSPAGVDKVLGARARWSRWIDHELWNDIVHRTGWEADQRDRDDDFEAPSTSGLAGGSTFARPSATDTALAEAVPLRAFCWPLLLPDVPEPDFSLKEEYLAIAERNWRQKHQSGRSWPTPSIDPAHQTTASGPASRKRKRRNSDDSSDTRSDVTIKALAPEEDVHSDPELEPLPRSLEEHLESNLPALLNQILTRLGRPQDATTSATQNAPVPKVRSRKAVQGKATTKSKAMAKKKQTVQAPTSSQGSPVRISTRTRNMATREPRLTASRRTGSGSKPREAPTPSAYARTSPAPNSEPASEVMEEDSEPDSPAYQTDDQPPSESDASLRDTPEPRQASSRSKAPASVTAEPPLTRKLDWRDVLSAIDSLSPAMRGDDGNDDDDADDAEADSTSSALHSETSIIRSALGSTHRRLRELYGKSPIDVLRLQHVRLDHAQSSYKVRQLGALERMSRRAAARMPAQSEMGLDEDEVEEWREALRTADGRSHGGVPIPSAIAGEPPGCALDPLIETQK